MTRLTNCETAAYRAAWRYFQRERIVKATRRETTSGAGHQRSVGMTAGVVRVYQIRLAEKPGDRPKAQRTDTQAEIAGAHE